MYYLCNCCNLVKPLDRFNSDNIFYSICDICRISNKPTNYSNIKIYLLSKYMENTDYIGGRDISIKYSKFNVINGHIKTIEDLVLQGIDIDLTAFYTSIHSLDSYRNKDIPQNLNTFLNKLNLPIPFKHNDTTKELRDLVRKESNFKCHYCNLEGYSVDHKNPVSLSMDNSKNNLVNSCEQCNLLKGTVPYIVFISWLDEIREFLDEMLKLSNLINSYSEEIEQYRKNNEQLREHFGTEFNDLEMYKTNKEYLYNIFLISSLTEELNILTRNYDEINEIKVTFLKSKKEIYNHKKYLPILP